MISFIHTADVHLDAPVKSVASDLRQHDFRLTMQRIRDLVISKQADFWLIAGDLLEYYGATRSTVYFLHEVFASVDPIPVFISPGNHDPWVADSYYQTVEWPPNVIFFTPEWGAYEFPEKSVVVYGWGFPQAHVSQSPLLDFPGKLAEYQYHLMVLHGSVGKQLDHQPYAPLTEQQLLETGMDYIALGHIHKPCQFTHPNSGLPFAAYPGSPEGLTAKETGERHVLYGRIDPRGAVTLQALPVQSRKILQVDVPLTGIETEQALYERIKQTLAACSREDMIYVQLTEERASHLQISTEVLSSQFRDHFFIQFRDHSWPDVDQEKLVAEAGVLGRWLAKLAEREAACEDERARKIVQLARQEALKRIGGSMR